MASPFPGMDPYLEGDLWQEFHATLAGEIRAQLLPYLRPKYVALLAKRYVLDRPLLSILEPQSSRIVYPDVHIVQPPGGVHPAPIMTAGLSMMPTIELQSYVIDEVPITSVEIRDIAERRLVTLVEILSPVNKRGDGAREYAARRLELMQTATHLLEIDLLVQGIRIQLDGVPPATPYYVYLSRANRRPMTAVWAMTLQESLPKVPVPLLRPDPDVTLDLQAAVDACFALVGYEQLLDYRSPPPATLSSADTAWVTATLQAQGLRPV